MFVMKSIVFSPQEGTIALLEHNANNTKFTLTYTLKECEIQINVNKYYSEIQGQFTEV